jgi:hypothetical protein
MSWLYVQRFSGPSGRRPTRRGPLAVAAGLGHEQVEFTVIGSGPNGTNPHHKAGDRTIEVGDAVVLDFGGLMYGYGSEPRASWLRLVRDHHYEAAWLEGGERRDAKPQFPAPDGTTYPIACSPAPLSSSRAVAFPALRTCVLLGELGHRGASLAGVLAVDAVGPAARKRAVPFVWPRSRRRGFKPDGFVVMGGRLMRCAAPQARRTYSPSIRSKGRFRGQAGARDGAPRRGVSAGQRTFPQTTSDRSRPISMDKGSQVQILSARLRNRL